MKESEIDYRGIPYKEISEGKVHHKASLSGYELDTHAFRQEIGKVFELTDADEQLENSFLCWESGRPVTSIIRQMSTVLPEILNDYNRMDDSNVEAYRKLDQIVVEQLLIAKNLVAEKLKSLNIPEGEMLSPKNVKQYDTETKAAISNVQEYAWYLTLTHQRWVTSVVMNSPEWDQADSDDRSDLLQASFINAWKLALKFDPEKGTFTTYLGASLPNMIQRSYSEIKGFTRSIKYNYIDSFSEAQGLLHSTPFESGYWISIATSMIYDRRVGRLTYDQDNFIYALIEYANLYLHPYVQTDSNERSYIEWRRHKNTTNVVQARIKRAVSAISIFNPESSEEIHHTYKKDPETGEIEIRNYSLDEFFISSDNVEEEAYANLRKEIVVDALEKLPDDKRELIENKYGFNGQREMTNSELAMLYKVSGQTIRNRLDRILSKLYSPYIAYRLRKFIDLKR